MSQEESPELEGLKTVANLMALAARTAPKAKGVDNIVIKMLDDSQRRKLVETMRRIGKEENIAFFLRDAENVEGAAAVVVLGTRLQKLGLPHCGFCGFKDCQSNTTGVCAFNVGDLGIACGSAAAVAARHHVDTRTMFSIGRCAVELGLLGPEVRVAYGFPLSATGKNPFFDRH